jgi:hypothetical protein
MQAVLDILVLVLADLVLAVCELLIELLIVLVDFVGELIGKLQITAGVDLSGCKAIESGGRGIEKLRSSTIARRGEPRLERQSLGVDGGLRWNSGLKKSRSWREGLFRVVKEVNGHVRGVVCRGIVKDGGTVRRNNMVVVVVVDFKEIVMSALGDELNEGGGEIVEESVVGGTVSLLLAEGMYGDDGEDVVKVCVDQSLELGLGYGGRVERLRIK